MGLHYWVLDENLKPQPATLDEWGAMFESPERFLFRTQVEEGVVVKTVFIGHDNDFELGLRDEPLLFGTRIFGGRYDHEETLTATWTAAADAHQAAIIKATS